MKIVYDFLKNEHLIKLENSKRLFHSRCLDDGKGNSTPPVAHSNKKEKHTYPVAVVKYETP